MNSDSNENDSDKKDCSRALGDRIDRGIFGFFSHVGTFVANRPKLVFLLSLLLAGGFGSGLAILKTENRPEELWVPQGTIAKEETDRYTAYFPEDRFSLVIVQSSSSDDNVLTKENLKSALQMHNDILVGKSEYDNVNYTLTDLCTPGGGTCADKSIVSGTCQCFVRSILGEWNYDLDTLENDDDILGTLQAAYNSTVELQDALGNPKFDNNDNLESAEAYDIVYVLEDRATVVSGSEEDPINSGWEKDVFLDIVQSDDLEMEYPGLQLDYFAGRSFEDEFGEAIGGDILLVQVAYIIIYFACALLIGRPCGSGSRWLVALSAILFVGMSTLAAIGLSSYFGLFYGPVHSLLPFVLLGIGVDDSFVVCNAFNRERKESRSSETTESLKERSARALARAGASITVTSATDLVAFAISSSSALPALASFCAYASAGIFFLWFFAATFFPATMVEDEKRQKANRCDLPLCCFKSKKDLPDDGGYDEGIISTYFRKYHAPIILSLFGKIAVCLAFAGCLGFGIYGALNLSVEDSQRNFVPAGSYIGEYFDAADEYFSSGSTSIGVLITFEEGDQIYEKRSELAHLDERVKGLSEEAPYIREPDTRETYKNFMTGLSLYLNQTGSEEIGGVTLGDDNWPTSYEDFVTTVANYTSFGSPGDTYSQDVVFDANKLVAYRVHLQYARLLKIKRGEAIDDAEKQIEAMDATREMVNEWDDLPPRFPYSFKFISIEGFKIIRRELFRNIGLCVLAVGIITFATLGNLVTALIVTVNVVFCVAEILGFMYAAGLVIDSISVINIVLAVGLSVDYSAHVAHNFMVKGGDCKNKRVTEALADIGASVLSGGLTTFLAVSVLLGSDSYVFQALAIQFVLTVTLGIAHGLILLPVLLSLLGPNPLSSAE